MKILHTSDWHLGHVLYGHDRTEEQQSMLNQMVHIVEEQQPDVFLLCGDVFHTSQPSNTTQTMLSDALMKIHEANPQMVIVMTAGNHDSPTKHVIFQKPWRALNVYAIGQLKKEELDEHIIEIPGKGFIIAIPHVNEQTLPEGFFQQLLDKVTERNTEGLPVVMTAHTTVKGCTFKCHEYATELTVGGIDAIQLEQLGEGYDYLALGHIHHGQFVDLGKHRARYSGTPLPISFDENFSHSISMVEIDKHGAIPTVTEIGIHNPRPLVTLPEEGFAPWETTKKLLEKYADDDPAYIRLNVEIEDFQPVEASAEAAKLTEGKQCRFCTLNFKKKVDNQAEAKVLTVQEFQAEKPIEIAKQYAAYEGISFDEEMTELFDEVLNLVENDARNEK
ncbi:MAG: exonuclease SbcCD subunit D [Bacteroidales bacterium]|nr:exonuclease SbcCD subunit D [Bacteroidales bacterium]